MTGCGATVENLDYLLLCLLIERSIMLLGIGSSTVEIYKFILHPINRYIPSLLRFPLGMFDSFALENCFDQSMPKKMTASLPGSCPEWTTREADALVRAAYAYCIQQTRCAQKGGISGKLQLHPAPRNYKLTAHVIIDRVVSTYSRPVRVSIRLIDFEQEYLLKKFHPAPTKSM